MGAVVSAAATAVKRSREAVDDVDVDVDVVVVVVVDLDGDGNGNVVDRASARTFDV